MALRTTIGLTLALVAGFVRAGVNAAALDPQPATAQSQAANPLSLQSGTNPAAIEFFEKKIRPLLADRCYNCHSANTNAKGGLRVDDRNGILLGGDDGAVIIPGHPQNSRLIKAVSYTDAKLKMPPKGQLSPEEVADLTKWIADGVAWPQEGPAFVIPKPSEKYEKLRKEHWAWQPLAHPMPPVISEAAWARDDVDRFVLAGLDKAGLKPAQDSDKVDLIRRVTFDLTGLPPTPEAINAFLNDSSTDALAEVVDQLLASPQYGERWGRHWLDVARYGESTGSSRNLPYPQAWRYRDYVIDAFNSDKPYDQFIREQIAGDLLPAKTQQEHDQHIIATGFLALGVKDVNQRFKVRYVMDNVDEQIDTVTRSVLAMTASCARCHDHKFDPIPQTDYYGLAGIFTSTDLCAGLRNKMGGGGLDYYDTQMLLHTGGPRPPPDPATVAKIQETKKALAAARDQFQSLQNNPAGDELAPNGRPKRQVARQRMLRLQRELAALMDPAADGLGVIGVRDAATVGDTQIRIRGVAENLGPTVPRTFLSIVQWADEPKIEPTHSGRLELAEWLTSPKNPLTARVIVNRVWKNLFGEGIVDTVDNFGVTGDVPSHPELLDFLATRFQNEGWSVKKLVRELVLTHTYQLSSDEVAEDVAVDPANKLLWRHSPRRLEAEEIRDAALAASGTLDPTRPVASPATKLQVIELANDGPVAAQIGVFAAQSNHRSVYLPLLRDLTPTSLEVFDFAEQGMVTGRRDATTVPTQALYLLNDPFVRHQSLVLARRVLAKPDLDDAARIEQIYRLTLGRSVTSQETEEISQYLADFQSSYEQVVATNPAATQPSAQAQTDTAPPLKNRKREIQAVALLQKPDNPGGGNGGGGQGAGNADGPLAEGMRAKIVVDPHGASEPFNPANSREAAWASFCQALLGSAEFRYLK
jgi:hypothetical protein